MTSKTDVRGLFVAIEGPNGVGKTTVCAELAAQLRERGLSVHPTTEPSATPLGRLLRSGEATLQGRALALGVAADRYAHLEGEVGPAVDAGQYVLSDRYVQSSLVLQRLDGMSVAEIWSYNRYVRRPDLSVYLSESPERIAVRLAERRQRSRLETAGSPERELRLYREAYEFLQAHGWTQIIVKCRGQTPARIAHRIVTHLHLLTK
ncbi:dTMP kinase [Fodinicola acaciae]|uniref:dTMP kinase n=1 Tax=Fodinicola acaciae TaxID=2681555 RepID=UPI0013D11463|nr:dTMP kinase [Fodinicola acaciae]